MSRYTFGKIFLSLWLTAVIIAGFAMPMVPTPQTWYQLPWIPGLEEKARIILFHVPMAWVTLVAFVSAMIYGIRYLKTKNLDYDLKFGNDVLHSCNGHRFHLGEI